MSEEKPVQDVMAADKTAPERRPSRSAFAPVVLIAAGVLFLLNNLGLIGPPDWQAALRFWPLALIFLGLNVLVVQARRPVGTILSLLVALAAVVVFGRLLLQGSPDGLMSRLGLAAASQPREESFAITRGAAETAAISLDLGNHPSRIAAGDGETLIAGSVWTTTGLDVKPHSEGSHVAIEVREQPGGFLFGPDNWPGEAHTWEFTLNPDIPTHLTLDAGNGRVSAELDALTLSELEIDAANGALGATLPTGDYDIRLDGGNGSITLTLPASGRREMRVDGGNGAITLLLPDGVAARVAYDDRDAVRVDDRFVRVAGDDDKGAYETAGYEDATDRVLIIVDGGNGRVTIASP